MAYLNEITEAKEILREEMLSSAFVKPEVHEAIEVMEDKIEELVNYGW